MKQYDVAIIGSGAAGSVLAWKLSQAGMSVIVLEKGRHEDPRSFSHNEFEMMPRLYKHGGLQTTSDNGVVILQGMTVGGSTVINNAVWKRAELDRILLEWKKRGTTVEKADLEKGYSELERLLFVSPISADLPAGVANRTADIVKPAAASLGFEFERLKNNRSECIGCGWCNYGCQYSRKTSMLVTLLPWACSKGAVIFDQCKNVRINTKARRATGVEFQRSGKAYTITTDKVIVSAGAIGSSEVLLQSGIFQNGNVGRGLSVLGGVVVNGLMEERLDNFDGIGLTALVNAGSDNVIETFFSPPGAFAATMSGWFEGHASRMRKYSNYIQMGVMVGTDPVGTVRIQPDGTTNINLTFSRTDIVRLKKGIGAIAEMFFCAHATTVYPGTFDSIEFDNQSDLKMLDSLTRPDDFLIGSAHPQGGNPMNEDPRGGVIGPDFRIHGFENLYVADASVFPSNIWVNCQATVMAMAHIAAGFVAQ